MTLTEFLAARYTEAHVAAREAKNAEDWEWLTSGANDAVELHIANHHPTAVLADLAVKRELLDLYTTAGNMSRDSDRYREWGFTWVILNKIVLMEATRYADHPDFNPAWSRP